MQKEWHAYRDKMYPDGISHVQNVECHKAFFAGATLILEKVVVEIAELPEGEAEQALEKLLMEVKSIVHAIAACPTARQS